ncbi:type IV toxin-antitoxin system AbiEi family antitoxin domain-containing protein [Isoptericola sp. BMS4]|uniref:type IV toxin-antitoxin system AbiEi family antitoxin domain-containing protein n=1 Tax=Isoptericola sp. BMS4 TaxID=2527875 RepID=UPI001421B35D|nr:type IV toxin-antitoxin system AbiEi family antitoxin domain-containing protein [Isoptericola sp. BMS4]
MPRRIVVPAPLQRVASFQDGLVSTGQCRTHGMTYRQVGALVADGRWERVVRGVLDTGSRDRAALVHDAYDLVRRRAAILGTLAYPGSVATGLAALVLQDVQGAPQRILPDVGFPDGSPARAAAMFASVASRCGAGSSSTASRASRRSWRSPRRSRVSTDAVPWL